MRVSGLEEFVGKAAYDPGSAPAKDRSQCLKKNRGGTSGRGQLERSTAARCQARGLQQPALARPTGAALQDLGPSCAELGALVSQPPTAVTHAHPILGSGGVVWRGGGFKSPRVSDGSDRSPNSSQAPVPRRGSERPSGPRASPDPEASHRLPLGLEPLCLLKPFACRLTRQGSFLRLRNPLQYSAVGLTTLPNLFFPHTPWGLAGPMDSKERSEGNGNCVLRPIRIAASSGDLVL